MTGQGEVRLWFRHCRLLRRKEGASLTRVYGLALTPRMQPGNAAREHLTRAATSTRSESYCTAVTGAAPPSPHGRDRRDHTLRGALRDVVRRRCSRPGDRYPDAASFAAALGVADGKATSGGGG